LIPTPPDPFEEWLRAPTPDGPKDSRFIVRRALPEEYERIFDTIDAAFRLKRRPEVFDWLYRRNPHGFARCWILVERVIVIGPSAGSDRDEAALAERRLAEEVLPAFRPRST